MHTPVTTYSLSHWASNMLQASVMVLHAVSYRCVDGATGGNGAFRRGLRMCVRRVVMMGGPLEDDTFGVLPLMFPRSRTDAHGSEFVLITRCTDMSLLSFGWWMVVFVVPSAFAYGAVNCVIITF